MAVCHQKSNKMYYISRSNESCYGNEKEFSCQKTSLSSDDKSALPETSVLVVDFRWPKQWIKGCLVNVICEAKSVSKQDIIQSSFS